MTAPAHSRHLSAAARKRLHRRSALLALVGFALIGVQIWLMQIRLLDGWLGLVVLLSLLGCWGAAVALFARARGRSAMWGLIFLLGAPAIIVLAALKDLNALRDERAEQGLCPACGYDVVGCPDASACPECGYALSDIPGRTRSELRASSGRRAT